MNEENNKETQENLEDLSIMEMMDRIKELADEINDN